MAGLIEPIVPQRKSFLRSNPNISPTSLPTAPPAQSNYPAGDALGKRGRGLVSGVGRRISGHPSSLRWAARPRTESRRCCSCPHEGFGRRISRPPAPGTWVVVDSLLRPADAGTRRRAKVAEEEEWSRGGR
jgi:hypothetical protein